MARRSGRVVDKDLGFLQIQRELREIKNTVVMVGFQATAITKTQSKNGNVKKAGESIASIAAKNEYGFDKIPARPFISTAIDENINNIYRLIDKQYTLIGRGKRTAKKMAGTVGQYAVSLIQKKIRQITQPPNSPVTIAIKKSSKPLIDFGQMVRSVTYVVAKK